MPIQMDVLASMVFIHFYNYFLYVFYIYNL